MRTLGIRLRRPREASGPRGSSRPRASQSACSMFGSPSQRPTMPSRPDFVVYSPDHKLQLVVEVKGTPKSDPGWAAKLRRNLLEHEALPQAPYFLLVLPDHVYLWSHASRHDAPLPDFQADTRQVLKRYLEHWEASQHATPLSERGLELAVQSWLSDLTRSDNWTQFEAQSNAWLDNSGLVRSIRTGIVESESAA